MSIQQLKNQKYSLKGSAQCTDECGLAKRQLQVLADADYEGRFSYGSEKNHAHVVLQEGSGVFAKTIACFSADQARNLARALNAAADPGDREVKADC